MVLNKTELILDASILKEALAKNILYEEQLEYVLTIAKFRARS